MSNRLSKIIDDDSFNRGIQIESAGNPDARPRRKDGSFASSAAGLPQFLTGTWNTVGQKHYPELVKKHGANWAAMRMGKDTTPIQLQMMARFWEDNAKTMGSTKDGDLYLAHFLGAGGARKVVKASPGTSAVEACGEAAAKANPTIFYHKDGTHVTCAELRSWAEGSMRKRWEINGKKDWVGIWGGNTLPPPPSVGSGEIKSPEVVAGGGAVVTGGGAIVVAANQGVDWSVIFGIGACAAVVAMAVFFIVRAARKGG